MIADTRITAELGAEKESKFHILWDRVAVLKALRDSRAEHIKRYGNDHDWFGLTLEVLMGRSHVSEAKIGCLSEGAAGHLVRFRDI